MKKRKRVLITIAVAALLIGMVIAYKRHTGVEAQTEENGSVIQNETVKPASVSDSTHVSEKQEETSTDNKESGETKDSENSYSSKPSGSGTVNTQSSQKQAGHYETIPAYDETILVREAYDEQVLVKKGECTEVKISDAWDEEVWESGAWYGSDTVEAKVCNGCGAIFCGSISEHMSENPDHGGWHNEQIPQGDPYWHGNRTIVHHDAVYETRCEPDEYTTVHHEAEYTTVHHEERRVWVED